MNFVDVEWSPPTNPNGQIEFYNVILYLKYFSRFALMIKDVFSLLISYKYKKDFYLVQIRLSGMATYINGFGKLENDMFGPEIKTVVSSSSDNPMKDMKLKTRFDFLRSNTNYTVNVCAVTRQKECGTVSR